MYKKFIMGLIGLSLINGLQADILDDNSYDFDRIDASSAALEQECIGGDGTTLNKLVKGKSISTVTSCRYGYIKEDGISCYPPFYEAFNEKQNGQLRQKVLKCSDDYYWIVENNASKYADYSSEFDGEAFICKYEATHQRTIAHINKSTPIVICPQLQRTYGKVSNGSEEYKHIKRKLNKLKDFRKWKNSQ